MRRQKNLFPSGLWTEFLNSDCIQGRKTKSEDAVDWSRMCPPMSGELCQNATSILREQDWVLHMLFFCCIDSFHDDFAQRDRMSSFRLNNQKRFLVSHFPFNMKRLEICKEVVLFFKILFAFAFVLLVFVQMHPQRETQKRIVCLWIATVLLTCERKAAKSCFQPSFTSVKFLGSSSTVPLRSPFCNTSQLCVCTDRRATGGHQDSDNFFNLFSVLLRDFFLILFFLTLLLMLTLPGIPQLSPASDKCWLLPRRVVAKADETIPKVACMLPKTEEEFSSCCFKIELVFILYSILARLLVLCC